MSIDTIGKRKAVPLAFVGVVAIALLVRVLWALIAASVDPVLRANELHGDASGYQILALNLLEGRGLTWDGITQTSYRMPGYPAFLALTYWLSGTDLRAARLVQAIIGALTCIPVYAVTRRLADDKTALLAAVGVALFPLLIYMSGWLYSESVFIFLLWVAVWLMLSAMMKNSVQLGILAGIVIGIAALFRPEVIMLPLFLVLLAALASRARDVAKTALFAFLASIFVMVPWFVRNFSVHDELVLLTTSSGSNLYAGNNPLSKGGSVWTFPLEGMSEVESDRELQRRAVEWMTNNPITFLKLLPQKALRFFSPLAMEVGSLNARWWMLPINIAYSAFLVFAALGAAKTWRTAAGICVLSLVSLYFLTSLIFYGGTRVALPVAPGLIALAATALIPLLQRIQGGVVFGGPETSAGKQVMVE